MTGKLTRDAYRRLIEEDLQWLMKQPRTLERSHIAEIIKASERNEYGPPGPNTFNFKVGDKVRFDVARCVERTDPQQVFVVTAVMDGDDGEQRVQVDGVDGWLFCSRFWPADGVEKE